MKYVKSASRFQRSFYIYFLLALYLSSNSVSARTGDEVVKKSEKAWTREGTGNLYKCADIHYG